MSVYLYTHSKHTHAYIFTVMCVYSILNLKAQSNSPTLSNSTRLHPPKNPQIVTCIVTLYTRHYNHILQFYIEETVLYFVKIGLGMRFG